VQAPGIRHLGLALAAGAAVTAFAPQVAAPATDGAAASAVLETQVAGRVNAVRRGHGLRPLRYSRALAAAARRHSQDMANAGYFEHDSVGGVPFWKRIERHYRSRGFSRWEVGENILWSSGRTTAVGIVRQWLGSPEHRANLLSRTWREFGLGALRVPRAGGTYGGRAVTIVTLDFGVRVR
jgi:uncharacterized protein YkwD